MKSIGNKVLLSLDKEMEDTIVTDSGLELQLDTDFNTLYHAKRDGYVFATNPRMEAYGLKKGVHCYFHHFVTVESNEWTHHQSMAIEELSDKDKKIYQARVHPMETEIYAYDDGDTVTTLFDYVFVRPIINDIPQTESGIYLESVEKEELEVGEVVYLNEVIEAHGLKKGDIVRFAKDSEYDMEIKGETLYRMTFDDIYGVLTNR